MKNQDILNLTHDVVMRTYGRLPIALVKGKGARVWDAEGREYLDFLCGIAVTNLGHGYPRVTHALARQLSRLVHVSNIFHIEPQAQLAKLLVEHSFADKVFFCNSGAEANEAAIKLARKFAHTIRKIENPEIITFENSFHGRTLAMLAATGQKKFRQNFGPEMPGFVHVPFGEIDAVAQALTSNTCAVMVEPIQGEGGVKMADATFFKALRDLCHEKKVLLIFDEVQVGIGRTGTLFAYESFGIHPDLMTLAKALGSGLPIGALLATEQVAEVFQPGDHASTFGGNPLACAAGLATLESLLEDGILDNCREQGRYLEKHLRAFQTKYPSVVAVRGQGLIWGLELNRPGQDLVLKALKEGLLINCVKENILRFLPPLIIKKKEIDQAMAILDKVFQNP